MIDITSAQNDTTELYSYLAEISRSIVNNYSAPVDDIVKKLSKNIDTCSNEELRTYMGKLSIEAYNLSIFKEQSSLKDSCAEALYKEKVARSFNISTGTVDARRNQSIIEAMDRQAVAMLYKNVSDLFKAKTDEAHRIVSTINGILISRAADAKISYNPRSEESTGGGFVDVTSEDDVDFEF